MDSPELEVLVFLIVSLPVVVALYRRFRRTAGAVPWTCQAAAAIALCWGVVTALAGIGHSLAVTSVALSEREYGNLQILWFTTGAMLLYVGTMNASLYLQPAFIAFANRSQILECEDSCSVAVLEGYAVAILTRWCQAGELFAGRVEDRQEVEAGRLRDGLVRLLLTRSAGTASVEPTGSVLADVAVPFLQFERLQRIHQNVIPGIFEDS